MERTIAIGDIHGCSLALNCLLEAIRPGPLDRLVVLGDFVDQGLETAMVIDRLILLREQCELISLQGNHEEVMLAAATNEPARRYWEVVGGAQTLNSYRYGATSVDVVPDDHWEFIRGCREYYETEDTIFVHANFDPQLPMDQQPPHALRWQPLDPQTARCHRSGKTAIVGHTEQLDGEVLDLACIRCIDTACWRYGWLTALDVRHGTVWQASRFGQLRQQAEPPVGPVGPKAR